MMCIITALRRDAGTARRWALIGGVAFGTYLLTWGGAVLLVACLVAWASLQVVADALRGTGSEDVTRVLGPLVLVAAVMVAPWARTRPYFAYQFAALVGGTIAIWSLHALQRVGRRRAWGPARWIAVIAGIGAVAGLVGTTR